MTDILGRISRLLHCAQRNLLYHILLLTAMHLLQKRIEGCGTVEVHITLKDALIAGITFRGDYFSTLPPEDLAAKFMGLPLKPGSLRYVLETCRAEDYITGLSNEDLIDLLCT